MKIQPLHRLAATALTGTLLLATSVCTADDKDKKVQKPAPKAVPSQPLSKPAPPPRPVQVTPLSRPAATPSVAMQHPGTIQSALNRIRSNPYEVNTSPRTATVVVAAASGAKHDLDRITRTDGSTQTFDGGPGNTLNSGVRPSPVQASSSTARTTVQSSSAPTPRSSTTTPPPPAPSAKSNSPSLREKLRGWLR